MQADKGKKNDAVASGKAAMEKTNATFQEKAERMTSNEPEEKGTATGKTEERMYGAEMNKREADDRNAPAAAAAAAVKHAAGMGGREYCATTADSTNDYGTPPAYNDPIIPNIVGEAPILSDLPTGRGGAQNPDDDGGFGSTYSSIDR